MSRYNKTWVRQETLAAFGLYLQIPFGTVHSRNPEIIALAEKMGRTPGALSMKIANLASLDPAAPAGLSQCSKLDKEVWENFCADQGALMYECAQARAEFEGVAVEKRAEVPLDILQLPEGEERERMVRTRVKQSAFRRAVLAAYDKRCCITRLGEPRLLNASHIVPWNEGLKQRLDPRNGLCLNALHDRAFDRGLITVRPSGKVVVSGQLIEKAKDCQESAFIVACDGQKIDIPDRFPPEKEFLEYHNSEIFQDT